MSRENQRPGVFLAGCLTALLAVVAPAAYGTGGLPRQAGRLSVLSYNVAGLPLGLSGARPARDSRLISPLLNEVDLVLVQEDFGYHEALVSQDTHPYRSPKDRRRSPLLLPLGSGLQRLSSLAFEKLQHVRWQKCAGIFWGGSDCLAPKGFSVARHALPSGHVIDVYNLHADAKDEAPDKAARRIQLRQLAGFIESYSRDRAVLVVGDTNSRYTRRGDILPELLRRAQLRDVWLELERSGELPKLGRKLDGCRLDPSEGSCEQVDKIFFRDGGGVTLTPLAYRVESQRFRAADGQPLSDHEPVFALFGYRLTGEPSLQTVSHGAVTMR